MTGPTSTVDPVTALGAHGTLRTGPSGQVWDVTGHLKANTRYALVPIGATDPKENK